MSEPTVLPPMPEARVLVVDDEPRVRSAVVCSLIILGYRADEAESGPQALGMLRRTPYDLMMLDIRMPGMDGVEVMRRARQVHPDLPIIILTGHASLGSAIAAVRSQAADYLLKPVNIHDIAAAVAGALQQDAEKGDRQRLLCDPVTLDREGRLVTVAGADDADSLRARLTTSESALLAHLMQHPHTVFSCCELARNALGYDVGEEEAQRIIRPHICRLRKKIEPDPAHPRLIHTIPGKGYLFSP